VDLEVRLRSSFPLRGQKLKSSGLKVEAMVPLKPERSLPMVRDCKVHYGQSVNEALMKTYKLPNETDVMGMFNEKTGELECFSYYKRFYPIAKDCPNNMSKLKGKGLIYVKNEEVSYDNCLIVISDVVHGATNTQTDYYVDVLKEDSEIFPLCFRVEVRSLKIMQDCPKKYRDYKIDVRSFRFRLASTTSIKYATFYRSPSVAQYEHLKTIDFPMTIDDYVYESHENEYDITANEKFEI